MSLLREERGWDLHVKVSRSAGFAHGKPANRPANGGSALQGVWAWSLRFSPLIDRRLFGRTNRTSALALNHRHQTSTYPALVRGDAGHDPSQPLSGRLRLPYTAEALSERGHT